MFNCYDGSDERFCAQQSSNSESNPENPEVIIITTTVKPDTIEINGVTSSTANPEEIDIPDGKE